MKTVLKRITLVGVFCSLLLLSYVGVSAANINSAGSLSDIVTGEFTEGNNSPKYYKVNVSTPGYLSVDLVAEYYSRLMLLSSYGDEIFSSDKDINDSGVSHQNKKYYLDPGTYYVGFGALRGIFITTPPYGKYTLQSKFVPVYCNEQEKNSTLASANSITMNQKINGIFTAQDYKDFFKIQVGSTGKYTLTCNASTNIKAYIYTPSGDYVAGTDANVDSSTGQARIKKDFDLPAGTYCILLQPRADEGGAYDFVFSGFVPTPITGAIASEIGDYRYNGKFLCPSVRVSYNGKILKSGRDYTVSYRNNKKPGKAEIIITGIGDYCGTLVKSFKILPSSTRIKSVKSTSKGKVKVSFKKAKGATGYQILYSKNYGRKYKKAGYTKKTSFTIKKLKSGKYYYIKVRPYKVIDGKKCFGYYSSSWGIRVK